MKVLTLRLPAELYDDLKELARVDGKSMVAVGQRSGWIAKPAPVRVEWRKP